MGGCQQLSTDPGLEQGIGDMGCGDSSISGCLCVRARAHACLILV